MKLCQPAILPIQIDVYPTQEEFNELYSVTSIYDLNLRAMDITYYKTHADLLGEMVRQRIIQDFQLVPEAVIMESRKKTKMGTTVKKSSSENSEKDYQRKPFDKFDFSADSPPIALSMEHRLQTIQLKPDLDSIGVVVYTRKDLSDATFKYNFQLWLPASKRYAASHQSFFKYPNEYNWNGLDNLICGDMDKTLTESTRLVITCL